VAHHLDSYMMMMMMMMMMTVMMMMMMMICVDTRKPHYFKLIMALEVN
jgi:hypothetical protein